MTQAEKEALDLLYAEILDCSRDALLRGGTPDPYLAPGAADDRMGLALVIRPDDETAGRICRYLEPPRAAEPGLYCYPAGDLHLTVLDLIGAAPGQRIPERWDAYLGAVRRAVREILPFCITFAGMTASESALLVRGYPDPALQRLRQSLRCELTAAGIPARERYETRSAHLTAARVAAPLRDPRALLEFLRCAPQFGTVRADTVELVFHNWYDSKKERAVRIPLPCSGEKM